MTKDKSKIFKGTEKETAFEGLYNPQNMPFDEANLSPLEQEELLSEILENQLRKKGPNLNLKPKWFFDF